MTVPGIESIGLNGLGAPSAYSSYDMYMPSTAGIYGIGGVGEMGNMYGMNPMMGGYGMMNPSFMGGYGMMNPSFMGGYGMYGMDPEALTKYYTQMSTAQHNIEKLSLQHNADMHKTLMDTETQAKSETQKATIDKLIRSDSNVQQGIYRLHDEVKKGNGEGVEKQYMALCNYIDMEFADSIKEKGMSQDIRATRNHIIEALYTEISGENLRDSIMANCENAVQNGFNQGFKGGHNTVTGEEVLKFIYNENIDNEREKNAQKKTARVAGYTAGAVKDAAIGAAAGSAVYLIHTAVAKGGKFLIGDTVKSGVNTVKGWFGKGGATEVAAVATKAARSFNLKHFGKYAVAGAFIYAIGDLIWKLSKDK